MSFQASSSILSYHAGMLADRVRVDSYRNALAEVVRPGDVVADLGTGTGLLAFFACESGASRVYAIDDGPVLGIAYDLSRHNGFDDRITLLQGHSTAIDLPEPVDVIVTETLWNFGLGEGLIRSVIDARHRFLKPGGRIVPAAVEMVAAPIEDSKAHSWVSAWRPGIHGIDYAAGRSYAANNLYRVMVEPERLLSEPAVLATVNLNEAEQPDAGGTATVRANRKAVVHGLGGWFRAQLSPGVELTNAPPNPTSSWWHAFAPVADPFEVTEGEELQLEVKTTLNGSAWSWACGPAGASAPRQSTIQGMPFPIGKGA